MLFVKETFQRARPTVNRETAVGLIIIERSFVFVAASLNKINS
jgi:hypothetical protein